MSRFEKHNAIFRGKILSSSKALNRLNSLGCSILRLEIGDKGCDIEILPPLKNEIKGVQTCVTGSVKGRQYLMQTKLHGCIVSWKTSSQPKMGHTL